MSSIISKQTLKRLPLYLSVLQKQNNDNVKYISATTIAKILGLNDVQVRKDLSSISNKGKPKVGYATLELIQDIETFLDYNNTKDAVIIGTGGLGKTLLNYDGFKNYGLNIVAGFDINAKNIKNDTQKQILPIEKLADMVKRLNIHIGIITTPKNAAQEVCDILVNSGVLAIWNFAPVNLDVPNGIIIQNENMAQGLAVLSNKLNESLNKNLKE